MLPALLRLQATAADGLFGDLLPWLVVLGVLVVLGGLAMYAARRLLRPESGGAGAEGFSLQSLRELHAAGELSDEEYQRARSAMIGRVRGPEEVPGQAMAEGSETGSETESGTGSGTGSDSAADDADERPPGAAQQRR